MEEKQTSEDNELVQKLQPIPALLENRPLEDVDDWEEAEELCDTLEECSRILLKRARSIFEEDAPASLELIEVVTKLVAVAQCSCQKVIFVDPLKTQIFAQYEGEFTNSVLLIIVAGSRICHHADDSILLTHCLRVLGSSKYSVEERTTAIVIITHLYVCQSRLLTGRIIREITQEIPQNFLAVATALEMFLDSIVDVASIKWTDESERRIHQIETEKKKFVECGIKFPKLLSESEHSQASLLERLHNLFSVMYSVLDEMSGRQSRISRSLGEDSYFDFMLKARGWSEKVELQLHTLLLYHWNTFSFRPKLWSALCSNMWTEAVWSRFHHKKRSHVDQQQHYVSSDEQDRYLRWTMVVKKSFLEDMIPSLVDKDAYLLGGLFRSAITLENNDRQPAPFDESRSLGTWIHPYLSELMKILLHLMGQISHQNLFWYYKQFLHLDRKWDQLLKYMWDIQCPESESISSVPSDYEFSLSTIFKSHKTLWFEVDHPTEEHNVRPEILKWAESAFQNDSFVVRLTAIKFFLWGDSTTLKEILAEKIHYHFLSSDSSELLLPERIEQGKPMLFASAALAAVRDGKIFIPDPLKLIRVSHELQTAFFPPGEASEESVVEEEQERGESAEQSSSLISRDRTNTDMWYRCSYAVKDLPRDLARALLTTPACSYLHDSKDEDEALHLALSYLIPEIWSADLYQLLRNDSRLREIVFNSESYREKVLDILQEISEEEQTELELEEKLLVVSLVETVCCGKQRNSEAVSGYFHATTSRECPESSSGYECLVGLCGRLFMEFICTSERLHQDWAKPGRRSTSSVLDLLREGEVVARLITPILGQFRENASAPNCMPCEEGTFVHSLLKRYPNERLIEQTTRHLLEVFRNDEEYRNDFKDLLEGDPSWYWNLCLGFLPTVTHESFPDRLELSIQDCHRLLVGKRDSCGPRVANEEIVKRGVLGLAFLLEKAQPMIQDLGELESGVLCRFKTPSQYSVNPPPPDLELQKALDTIMATLSKIAQGSARNLTIMEEHMFHKFIMNERNFSLFRCFMPQLSIYYKKALLQHSTVFLKKTHYEVSSRGLQFWSGRGSNQKHFLKIFCSDLHFHGDTLTFGPDLFNFEHQLACFCEVAIQYHDIQYHKEPLPSSFRRDLETLLVFYWRCGPPMNVGNVGFQLNLWLDYFRGKSCDKEDLSDWFYLSGKTVVNFRGLVDVFQAFFSKIGAGLCTVMSTDSENPLSDITDKEKDQGFGPLFLRCFQGCERLLAEYLLVLGALEAEEERQENIDSWDLFVPQLKELHVALAPPSRGKVGRRSSSNGGGKYVNEILSIIENMLSMLQDGLNGGTVASEKKGLEERKEDEFKDGLKKKRRRLK